jgi:hypothetical protein
MPDARARRKRRFARSSLRALKRGRKILAMFADAELAREFALRLRLNRQTFISDHAPSAHRSKTKMVSLLSLMLSRDSAAP